MKIRNRIFLRKQLRPNGNLRLLLVLSVAISLATLTGPMSNGLSPSLKLANATQQPCLTLGSSAACSEYWVPAGSSMTTLQASTQAGCTGEYTNLLSATPTIDLTDCSAPSATVPVCTTSTVLYVTAPISIGQFCYQQCPPPGPCSATNTWDNAVNGATIGLPNQFTWLNIHNGNPGTSATIRQGFSQTTTSVNPYIAQTSWDQYIVRNVYDSLFATNPLNPLQSINWMTENVQTVVLPSYNGGITGPPPGTITTYRFTLRPDLMWQDGQHLTSYDAVFSFLSMLSSGSPLAQAAGICFTGATILNPTQFDLGANTCTSALQSFTNLPILPGNYWTNAGVAAWASALNSCETPSPTCLDVQYTLTGAVINCKGGCASFPVRLMTVDPAKAAATYDPIASHNFVGSGPFQCGTVTTSGSGTCTSSGMQNPPLGGTYTLTAYTNYVRSVTKMAEWIWACDGNPVDILCATAIGACFNVSVNLAGICSHWQQGAGNPGPGTTVNINTVGIVFLFYGLNWVEPFNWKVNPPLGIVPLTTMDPILYALQAFDGSTTLSPSPTGPAGTSCLVPNTYYDC